MTNFCNGYFNEVAIDMAKIIPSPKDECKEDTTTMNSIFLRPVTESELIGIIGSLKNNSSPGHDGIQVKIIKQTNIEVLHPLLHIINLILEKGIVPSDFKISIITAIHKSGSQTSISNYRPVSLK